MGNLILTIFAGIALSYIIAVIAGKIAMRTNEIKSLKISNEMLTDEAYRTEEKNVELRAEIAKLRKENRIVQTSLEHSDYKNNDLFDKNVELSKNVDKLKCEKKDLQKKVEKLEARNKELQNADARNMGLYMRIDDLEKKIIRLKMAAPDKWAIYKKMTK